MYKPFWGGAELAVKEITDRIPSSEMHFDLIALRADSNLPEIETVGNVTVYRVGPSKRGITLSDLSRFPWYFIKILYPFLAVQKARALLREKKYDVAWSLMTYMGVPAVLMRMRGNKIPFVLTLQDGDTIEHITARLRIVPFLPLVKKAFRDANCVQVISNYLGVFAKKMGYPREPVLVPNGVDLPRFTTVHADEVVRIHAEFQKKEDELLLITTSRLVEKNGIGDVIDALPQLPNIRFLILGDGHLRTSLEERARERGVADRTIFLGHVAYEKLPTYLHASDIFIRASLSEGLGSSFLEAMAAGLPVVATPVGGIPDFLFDSETYGEKATGVFCKPQNPESIVHAISRLAQDTALRQQISANAKKLIVEKYDWDDIAKRMARVLSS